MKKQTLKIVCAALLVLASVFSLASCATWDGIKEDVQGAKGTFDFELQDNAMISLCSTDAVTVVATEDSPAYVKKTITATVTPADAANKTVNWQVYWMENTIGDDAAVTDYVNIFVSGEGNNTCEVRCYKAFGDSKIGIKATTVVGGYSADCTVTYVGVPSSLGFVVNGEKVTEVSKSTIGDQTITLKLDNLFGSVGASYGQYELVSVTANGVLSFEQGYKSSDGEKSQVYVSTGDINAVDVDKISVQDLIAFFVDCSVSDDQLILSSNFNKGTTIKEVWDDEKTVCAYYAYAAGIENVTFTITVKDTISGLISSINLKMYTPMEVAMTSTNIVF